MSIVNPQRAARAALTAVMAISHAIMGPLLGNRLKTDPASDAASLFAGSLDFM